MLLSYSKISLFTQCPYAYKLRYVDKYDTIFDCDPQNPLVLGKAIHTGIQDGLDAALNEYYNSYPIITDLQVNEEIKLEYALNELRKLSLFNNFRGKHEAGIFTKDFMGFIDLLECVNDDEYNIYDFKYTGKIEKYCDSPQLHLYKYFFEKANPAKRINKMYYVGIAKTAIRQKKTEDLYQFRQRLNEELQKKAEQGLLSQIIEVTYDPEKVADFLLESKQCIEAKNYSKNPSKLCDWCEYQKYCEKGDITMILPKNERRTKKIDLYPDMWIYGDSYVGKSTFVDGLEDLLFINTDGNTDNTTSPVVSIKDDVDGRNKIFAWQNFLDTLDELEKGSDFKRVAIDLVEDLYEHCRLYMYDKLKIQHEQDAGYGKGWDMVRTEFLSAMKRFKNLGYQIIFISKESATEVTLKNGVKFTTYAPNINAKIANVLTGIVDLTLRAYMDDKGHFLSLEKNDSVFGGGRFNFKNPKCQLELSAFMAELKLAQGGSVGSSETSTKNEAKQADLSDVIDDESDKPTESLPETNTDDTKPKRRARRSRIKED